MSRFGDVVRFLEFDHRKNCIVEPQKREDEIFRRLLEAIQSYRPRVIVKSGLGSGSLLRRLAQEFQGIITVVEPSLTLLMEFYERHGNDEALARVRYINGDFKNFPVDYYAADMLVCIDMLDILETGPVIDEFRRSLQFDGILFLAQVVLHEKDLEGEYDEMMRELHPLHTDYYIEEDLMTVMDLNEFTCVQSETLLLEGDLAKRTAHLCEFYGGTAAMTGEVLERHRGALESLYSYSDGVLSEPYFIGLFRRRKPE
ncbi:MAG: class I SAM-dependent methyltransferase [Spirochaetes bacterium]|nr:class I SAM-dependent methyltransferase [Spirochaetota bacterium]